MGTCTFCGRDKSDNQLVLGVSANICDECVWVCVDALVERGIFRPRQTDTPPEFPRVRNARCELCGVVKKCAGLRPDRCVCELCAVRGAQAWLHGPSELVNAIWGLAPLSEASREPLQSAVAVSSRTHLDLAHAYLDMGLVSDALTEAARAVVHTQDFAELGLGVGLLLEGLDEPKMDLLRALVSQAELPPGRGE